MSWLDLNVRVVPDSLIQRAKALQETLKFEQVEKERQARLAEEIRRRRRGGNANGKGGGRRQPRQDETLFGRKGPDRTIVRWPIGNTGIGAGGSIIGIAGQSNHRTTWLWPIKAPAPLEFVIDTAYQSPDEAGIVEIFNDLQVVSSTPVPNFTALFEFTRYGIGGAQEIIESLVLPAGRGRGIYLVRRAIWYVVEDIHYLYYQSSTQTDSGTPCGPNSASFAEMQANEYNLTHSPIVDTVHAYLFDDYTASQIDVPESVASVLRTWFPVYKPVFSTEQRPIWLDGVTGGGLVGSGSEVKFLVYPDPPGSPAFCSSTIDSNFTEATRFKTTATGTPPSPNYGAILDAWGLRTQYGIGWLTSNLHSSSDMYSPAMYTMIENPTGSPTLTPEQNTYADVRVNFLGSVSVLPTTFIDATYGSFTYSGPITLQTYNFRSTTSEPLDNNTPVSVDSLETYDAQPTLQGPIEDASVTLQTLKIAYDWGQSEYCEQKARDLGFSI